MIGTSCHLSAFLTVQYSGTTDNRSSLSALQVCVLTGHLSELEELHIASCSGIIHFPYWCQLLEDKELICDTDQADCIATT